MTRVQQRQTVELSNPDLVVIYLGMQAKPCGA
jgi:hypothetical protein